MKQITCTTVLKDLSGSPIKTDEKEFTLGQAIANILVADTSGGKMKLYTLGTRFYQDKTVDLDDSDFALVKNVVKNSTAYGAIIVGQVECILESI